jgi:uncharacterized protein with HEPN domain
VKKDFLVYLDDILDAIKKIKTYTRNMGFSEFKKDSKTVDAVIRNFEIIGEAAKQIPSEIKKKYPQIPWKQMAGMRNKVIHEYSGIELEVVWKTIEEDFPDLEKQIKQINVSYK